MDNIDIQCFKKKIGEDKVHLYLSTSRPDFIELVKAFYDIIPDKSWLTDINPNPSTRFPDGYPNHPQFSFTLDNGNEITISTHYIEKQFNPLHDYMFYIRDGGKMTYNKWVQRIKEIEKERKDDIA